MVLVLLGVSLLVFSVMMILPPGMRAAAYVKDEKIRTEQFDEIIEQYGLNDPAPVQYVRWLGNIFSGNFGYSTTGEAPVLEAFGRFFPTTFELVMYSTPIIILFGVWLGTLGAVHKDKPLDHGIRIFSIIGYSLPTFWLGLILLMLFYGLLGLFPPGTLSNEGKNVIFGPDWNRVTGLITIDSIINGNFEVFIDAVNHLLLPLINLIILQSALIMRLTRSNMLEALGQDYIRTAIAKGASKRIVNRKHARKNAMIPVITISGVMFARLMGGMVITETIFSRKGLGWWMARAATQLDVSAIMFNVLFLGTIFVGVNLIVDVIYAAVDPRIRLS